MENAHLELARDLAGLFSRLPEVEAVALGGSRGGAGVGTDAASDIDVYVYTRGEIALAARVGIVEAAGGATRADLGMSFWGPGDEWLHAPTGIHVDAIYFDAAWMEEQVDRVLVRHEASLGYTTCFWHTVRGSIAARGPTRLVRRPPGALRGGVPGGASPRHRRPQPPGPARRPPGVREPAGEGRDAPGPRQRQPPPGRPAGELLRRRLRRQPRPAPGREAPRRGGGRDLPPAAGRAWRPTSTRSCGRRRPTCPACPARVERLLDRLDALLAAEGLLPAATAGTGTRARRRI